jgi:hypothetical protein
MLRAVGLKPMEGTNNTRCEFWIDEDGCPEIVNYVGRDQQHFLKKDIDEIVAKKTPPKGNQH